MCSDLMERKCLKCDYFLGFSTHKDSLCRSSLVRFHPVKRFALAVASYSGAVTMFDIQSKKKLFHDLTAHKSPARDITMSEALPELFVSCGYDCNLNVYDLRQRSMVQQSQQPHPISTVCLSECGIYCVAGNLKGDVVSFDFRNLSTTLDVKRVHDGGVVRVAFVPKADESPHSVLDHLGETVSTANMTPGHISVAATSKDSVDSFNKFVDLCRANNDDGSHKSPSGLDSWLDLGAAQNHHDFSIDSVAHSPSRLSLGRVGELSELRLRRQSRVSLNNSVISDIAPACNVRRTTVLPDISSIGEEEQEPQIEQQTSKRSKFSDSIKHSLDKEGSGEPGNKENRQNNQQDIETFAKFIKDSHISTPNFLQTKSRSEQMGSDLNNAANIKEILSDIVDQKLDSIQTNLIAQMSALQTSVLQRIDQSENEIKFYQDSYYHSGHGDNFRLYKMMEREIEMLKEGMAVMLRDDAVANEFYRLKAENEELKRRLEKQ